MVAEPNLGNSKKKPVSTYSQHPGKVINHDYCYVCSGGGEIVCCDKCPKSFHSHCHIPPIILLPDGEWFCRSCTGFEEDVTVPEVPGAPINVVGRLKHLFVKQTIVSDTSKEFRAEIPIHQKFNVKLRSQKQLDNPKMIRKKERCFHCKQGVLRGRLVSCNYCSRLYHLNCLDIPIRDWDHNMRWLCPAHFSHLQTAYPELFLPGDGILSDFVTMKSQRCELPIVSKNSFFNVPSHILALYKTPQKYIPTISKNDSSLIILCGIASRELELLNSNHNTNYVNNFCEKFLPASQHLNVLENNNNLLCKQPYASLLCLTSSTPINISIQEKSFTIGISHSNNLCLQDLGKCECVSDYHATITFDDNLGDFLLKNHSRHGVTVDNVSYSGSHQSEDITISEMKLRQQVNDFLNKRRRIRETYAMFRLKNKIGGRNKCKYEYLIKKLRFDYALMMNYYSRKFKIKKPVKKIVHCMCSKRLIPKDGYPGEAVLFNGSMLFIGCLKFKFIYDTCTKEVPERFTEKPAAQQYGTGNQLNGFKPQSEQENCINLTECTRNEHTLVTFNRQCSLYDTDDKNSFNEQNNISLFDVDNSQDCSSSKEKTKMNGISKNIIMHKRNLQLPLDINLSDKLCQRHLTKNDDMLNECFASDLIQEVDVLSDDGRIIEEEIVYAMHIPEADISTANHLNDVQDWIIEEIVVDEDRNYNKNDLEHSINLQLSSALEYSDHNRGDYKTEHLYCARSPSYNEPIVISDDDE